MDSQNVGKKELNMEIMKKTGKKDGVASIFMIVLGIFPAIAVFGTFPWVLVITILLTIFVPKFRNGVVLYLLGTLREDLKVTRNKMNNQFYLVKRACTAKKTEEDSESTLYYLYFGKLIYLDEKMYYQYNVGDEFFLVMYEGMDNPDKIYPCAEWYIEENVRQFLRE